MTVHAPLRAETAPRPKPDQILWNLPLYDVEKTARCARAFIMSIWNLTLHENLDALWQFDCYLGAKKLLSCYTTLLCCPEITNPLLVGDIFSKSMKEAWFCYEKLSNVSVVMSQNDSEPFRPISATPGRFSIFFVISKKALFRWYTFSLRISIFESCEFYHYFGHVFYLQWKI